MGTCLTHTRLDQIKNFTLRFVWPCSQSQFCYIMRGMPCLDVVECSEGVAAHRADAEGSDMPIARSSKTGRC